MRIAIVNDMSIAVAALRRVLLSVPDYKVVWVARDGAEAVAKCAEDMPDLILMDLLMPVMDGVEATRQIVQNSNCAILVVTASAERNVAKVYEAMGYGALDAVDTPVLGREESAQMANQLLAKIATIRKLLKESPASTGAKLSARSSQLERRSVSSAVPLIAIGSSTGGPKALAAILSKLPASFSGAIAIVQHVDAHFSTGFVEWLNQQTVLPVRLAVAGDRLEPGNVLVAGTNHHLYLKSDLTLGFSVPNRDSYGTAPASSKRIPHSVKGVFDSNGNPYNYPYCPSVDVFFKSLAQHWTRKGTAILLTGMGRDGAEGLSALRQRGWHTIAQDKASCAVYGMPKAAVELNAASEVLPPDAIATALVQNIH